MESKSVERIAEEVPEKATIAAPDKSGSEKIATDSGKPPETGGRYFLPVQPSFNMPQRQSCPKCSAPSRRLHLTLTGAVYCCARHGEFIVVSKVKGG